MPDNLTTPLLSYFANFTTSLLTAACGRDAYSPLQTCADCQAAYRRWLCTISLPRCGEFPQPPDSQQPLALPSPALLSQSSNTTARNAALGNISYTALLPCLETCNAADRACPIFLGFRCPLIKYTASNSYGVGYIDSADGEVRGGGWPGVPQDRWGNVFCNIS
jgi:calcium channel MID1